MKIKIYFVLVFLFLLAFFLFIFKNEILWVSKKNQQKYSGNISILVNQSRTAQVFHIVDHISKWDSFCKEYYYKLAEDRGWLEPDDKKLLDVHKALRKKIGWANGLEKSFYSSQTIKEAAETSVKNGWLNSEMAQDETKILKHFAEKMEPWLRSQDQRLLDVENQFNKAIFQSYTLIQNMKNFAQSPDDIRSSLVVHVIPSPARKEITGGNNGGGPVVEIPLENSPIPTLLHEVFHGFLEQHISLMQKVIEETKSHQGKHPLSIQTLNEGIAYALAPGIISENPHIDSLWQDLLYDIKKGASIYDAENSIFLFRAFAYELRPHLKEALDSKMAIKEFLYIAINAWKQLHRSDGQFQKRVLKYQNKES